AGGQPARRLHLRDQEGGAAQRAGGERHHQRGGAPLQRSLRHGQEVSSPAEEAGQGTQGRRGIGLEELALRVRAELRGDGARRVAGVAPLDAAGPEHVSFYSNPRYKAALLATRAGAVIVSEDDAALVPAASARLVAAQPYVAFARASEIFHPEP